MMITKENIEARIENENNEIHMARLQNWIASDKKRIEEELARDDCDYSYVSIYAGMLKEHCDEYEQLKNKN